jgi:UDP-glucose 4-epimerase
MARATHDNPDGLFHFGAPEAIGAGSAPATETWIHPRGGAKPGETVLITGISGGQGRLIARRLASTFDLVGVDRSFWEGHPPGLRVHKVDIRKRKFEDIFRTERPSAVVHLAFIRHFRGDAETRHEVNVLGTKRLLEYAIAHGVKRVIVLSSHYVYGALPDNPYYMDEDSPLNVSRNYPEVRDLSEVDTLATAFLWRHPEVATSILRPVNTLGYYVHSTIGRYLRQRYVPTIMGFNPMMQFIHEEDVPFPEPVARAVFSRLWRWGLFHTPLGAMNFLKYPCTLDGRRFQQATGFTPLFSLEDVFASVRR